jgi:DNA helicase-2/ATP-dependent DNA helicase PcrA
VLRDHPHEDAELTYIVGRIKQLLAAGTPAKEIAILYRINARSIPFEKGLHDAEIAFQVAAGGFLERQAWKSMRKRLALKKTSPHVQDEVAAELDEVGYVPHIRESEVSPQEYTRQIDLAFIAELAGTFGDGARTIAEFVLWVEDQFGSYVDSEARDAVRLSTYHLAKGLEWEAVFMPGLREGELPFWRAKTPGEIAEERRLFYVGITRAKTILELSNAGIAYPSRFLEEVAPPRAISATAAACLPAQSRRSNRGWNGSLASPTKGAPRLSPGSWRPDWMRDQD